MASRKLVIEVPEELLVAEETDEVAFAHELRLLAAIKLYELGRLSSGPAAGLAGMARVEFLLQLGRHRVFPFEAELGDLEAARNDPELAVMVPDYEAEVARLDEQLKLSLVEVDPADEKDVIVEIRQGVGGDEAALWAADLAKMLERYAERRRNEAEQSTEEVQP